MLLITARVWRVWAHDTTELRIADAITTAIGCPEALYDGTLDGTLDVFPNPRATATARAECGGSAFADDRY